MLHYSCLSRNVEEKNELWFRNRSLVRPCNELFLPQSSVTTIKRWQVRFTTSLIKRKLSRKRRNLRSIQEMFLFFSFFSSAGIGNFSRGSVFMEKMHVWGSLRVSLPFFPRRPQLVTSHQTQIVAQLHTLIISWFRFIQLFLPLFFPLPIFPVFSRPAFSGMAWKEDNFEHCSQLARQLWKFLPCASQLWNGKLEINAKHGNTLRVD